MTWNTRRAAMYYRKVRVADPNYEVACAWLANAQLKQGNTGCGDRDLPTWPLTGARVGAADGAARHLGAQQDKRAHAVRILRKALELDPEQGDAG